MTAPGKTSRRTFGRDDLLGATHVRIELSDNWLPVWRVNKKTVTVSGLWPWVSRVEFADVIDVRTVTK